MLSREQEFVIRGIRSYIRRYFPKPAPIWPKREFFCRAYERWTADELIEYIVNHVDYSPIYAMKECLKKFDDFACAGSKDIDHRYIFSIAYDTAQDIIDYVSYLLVDSAYKEYRSADVRVEKAMKGVRDEQV
jgi:hypothetical protein